MIVRELLAVFGIDFDDSGQKKADAAIKDLKVNFEKLGQVFAGSKLVGFFTNVVEAAADAQANFRRMRATFGDAGEGVAAWAESASGRLYVMDDDLAKMATNVGNLALGLGLTQQDAAKMGTTIAEAAVDMAAFFGEDQEAMLEALRGGLIGIDRPLKRFGMQLGDDALQQYALSRGIGRSVKSMTDQQKVALRFAKIQEYLARTQGAAARGTQYYGGAVKALQMRMAELRESLGTQVLPAATWLVTKTREGLEAFLGFADNTNLLKAAMWGLGVVAASLLIPTLFKLLLAVAPAALAFAAFAFIMDDVITTFEGGNSVLGTFNTWLDKMAKEGFPGLGTAAKAALETIVKFRDFLGKTAYMATTFVKGVASGNMTEFYQAWQAAEEEGLSPEELQRRRELTNPTHKWLPGTRLEPTTASDWSPTQRFFQKFLGEPNVLRARNAMSDAAAVDLEPTYMGEMAPLDNGGLGSYGHVVQAGDRTFMMTINQQPGESSEDFARRVSEIIDEREAQRDEALGAELLPAPAGAQ